MKSLKFATLATTVLLSGGLLAACSSDNATNQALQHLSHLLQARLKML